MINSFREAIAGNATAGDARPGRFCNHAAVVPYTAIVLLYSPPTRPLRQALVVMNSAECFA